MSKCVIMFRHGETDWNKLGLVQGVSDMPINEVGVAQASRLALFLKEQNIEHIFCSPLQRTMQTGEIIARACNVKMTVNDQFREANFGVAEGKCRKAIRSEYAQHFDVIDRIDHPNSHYMSLPGAESRMQVFNRVSDALITLVESIPYKTIGISSHGSAISSVLTVLFNCGSFVQNCDAVRLSVDAEKISDYRLLNYDRF